MMGDMSNQFLDTSGMASCVICPFELSFLEMLESL